MLDINEFEFYPASNVIADAVSQSIKPDPLVNVSTWANENRLLSTATSPEPGMWDTKEPRSSERSWMNCHLRVEPSRLLL